MKIAVLMIAPALLLGACTSDSCTTSNKYRSATSVAPIQGTATLVIASSQSALRVPEVTTVDTASPNPQKANKRSACLEWPPEIASDAAPAETPAK